MPAIVVSTWTNARGWIRVPVSVCGVWRGDFVLSTIASASSVSSGTASALDGFECLSGLNRREYVLRGLAIAGHLLPDLTVRVGLAATLVRVDGTLGLTFLNQFRSVHFDVFESTLTLELP
jgi:hypothetical protein